MCLLRNVRNAIEGASVLILVIGAERHHEVDSVNC